MYPSSRRPWISVDFPEEILPSMKTSVFGPFRTGAGSLNKKFPIRFDYFGFFQVREPILLLSAEMERIKNETEKFSITK